MREVNDNQPGYTHDTNVYEIQVTVEDTGGSTLKVTPMIKGSYYTTWTSFDATKVVFSNLYQATGQLKLTATKKLIGKSLEDKQYTFKLAEYVKMYGYFYDIQTKQNDANGNITFDPIEFDEYSPDHNPYIYKIYEEITDKQTGYTYDTHEEVIEVTIVDNDDGTLTPVISSPHEITFNNLYNAEGSVIIELNKEYINANIKGGEFSYTLYNENNEEIQTVSNNSEGKIIFSPIGYQETDIGTHRYKVKENKDNRDDIDFDSSIKEVEVIVEDNNDGTLKTTVNYKDNDKTFTNTKKGKVYISKEDEEGHLIEGATLVIKDSSNKEIKRWISSKEEYEIVLSKGEYTLVEEKAPEGYEKARDIKFKVIEDGKLTIEEKEVTKIVMLDKKKEEPKEEENIFTQIVNVPPTNAGAIVGVLLGTIGLITSLCVYYFKFIRKPKRMKN